MSTRNDALAPRHRPGCVPLQEKPIGGATSFSPAHLAKWTAEFLKFPSLGNPPLFPDWEPAIVLRMQIIALRTLRQFWEKHPQAETPIRVWYSSVGKAEWKGPADIKAQFGASIDFVGDSRVIFDLGGNKFRLIVHVSYAFKRVLVKFIGTHGEYDKIDAETL